MSGFNVTAKVISRTWTEIILSETFVKYKNEKFAKKRKNVPHFPEVSKTSGSDSEVCKEG